MTLPKRLVNLKASESGRVTPTEDTTARRGTPAAMAARPMVSTPMQSTASAFPPCTPADGRQWLGAVPPGGGERLPACWRSR